MIDESTIELVPGDTIEALVIDLLEESSIEERLQELERAMERLQAEERALLLLYYWQEKTVDEIGYRLSVFQPSYTMARSLSIYIYRNTRSSFAARRPSDQEGTPRQKGQVAVNHYSIIIFYRRKCFFIRKKELPLPRF